jgi:predicted transcriptional regulator
VKLTEPEWIIMNALSDKHPGKARDVVERLASSVRWAYTTVKTMLDRLVEKRAVKKSKSGMQQKVEAEGRQAVCT